jgi:hypothetical protein
MMQNLRLTDLQMQLDPCGFQLLSSLDPNLHLIESNNLYCTESLPQSPQQNSSTEMENSDSSMPPELPTLANVRKMQWDDFENTVSKYLKFNDNTISTSDRLHIRKCRARIRNRIFAGESRKRKKRHLEELEERVEKLEAELSYLRALVKQGENYIPEHITSQLSNVLFD